MPFICKRRPNFTEKTLFTSGTNYSLRKLTEQNLIWHDGSPPPDHVENEDALTFTQYVVIAAMACLGLAMAIFFLAFNIRHRNHKFVKLSSPRLNNVIIAGTVLIYLSICILWLEVGGEDRMLFAPFCMIHVWLIVIGTVLSLGALFSKTWRVYKLAASLEVVKSVTITDSGLFVQVGVFLLVGILILIPWTIFDPLEQKYNAVSIDQHTQSCTCEHFTIWATILIIYIGVVLAFGVFLAWHTKKITVPALNDSKLIGICIYNITILFAVTIGVCATIPDSPSFRYVFISSVLNFCASFTLITIFLPKVIFVCRFPNVEREAGISSNPSLSRVSSSYNITEISSAGDGNTGGAWERAWNQVRNFSGFSASGCKPRGGKDQTKDTVK